MSQYPVIEKASGEKVIFNPAKLQASLLKSGASTPVADEVVDEIIPLVTTGMSTQQIYQMAFSLLRKRRSSTAARYSLKKAIMELGPTGYPFEQFMGQVLAHQGFRTEVGQVLQGNCVTHEMDVIATANNTQYLVECKFYNSPGKFASVQVPLYVRSRVNDIIAFRKNLPEYKETEFHGWVVTNTRFTDDALRYGLCSGLNMLSWDFPAGKGLKDMIEQTSIFPITALTGLNSNQKRQLLEKDIVLCRQLRDNLSVLKELGIEPSHQRQIAEELDGLCG